jgi:hypothetical protein
MAITGKTYHTAYMDEIDDFTFQTYDYAIGGKMVVGRCKVTYDFWSMVENGDADAQRKLKYDLAHEMAMFMVENNLMEFTSSDDPITGNRQIAVRAYLAPNDQVKILRVANKI